MTDEVIDDVNQAIEDLMRPTKELDAKLAAREQQLGSELKTLREQRRVLRNVLRAVDPEMKKGQGPQNGATRPKALSAPKMISRENLTKMQEWMTAHAEEINSNGGMNRKVIFDLALETGAYKEPNRTTFMYGLRELHESGFVRLDHSEKMRGGPLHFFKVAA